MLGELRSRRTSYTTRDPSTPFVLLRRTNSAQDDSLLLFFFQLVVGIVFLTQIGTNLHAQPISIALADPSTALLQTDSATWSEAWIELSGVPPGEQPTVEDLRITRGKRVAEILSVDSVGWKFRSTLAASFVLDNSGSMFHAYDSLARMCDSIIMSLHPGAIGQAITFDDRYRGASYLYTSRSSTFIAQHAFTDSMAVLSQFWHFYDTIRTAFTPLYDAIGAAVTNITHRRERGDTSIVGDDPHNDVLIVVTDGEDNASRARVELIEKLLASANLRLFAINFRTEEDNRLQWLARKTGGEYFTANTISELRALLQSIGSSITQQYHVRYRFPTLGPSSGH